MKGSGASVSLRGHSAQQARTTTALLFSASTPKKKEEEKVSACANTQTLHALAPFLEHFLLTPLIP